MFKFLNGHDQSFSSPQKKVKKNISFFLAMVLFAYTNVESSENLFFGYGEMADWGLADVCVLIIRNSR